MSKIFLISDQPVLLLGFEHVLSSRGFEIDGLSVTADVPPLASGALRPAASVRAVRPNAGRHRGHRGDVAILGRALIRQLWRRGAS